ncbi:protein kinase [Apiospora hydei]|uniref:Protein kinase n=1 Tax=Apiospora hydei TaxID=1337664 RepID=A0ABR1UUA6_9PEZI
MPALNQARLTLPRSRRRWPGPVRWLSLGVLHDEIDLWFNSQDKPRIELAQTRELAIEALAEATGPDVEGDEWDVAWQPASRILCFKNRVAQEERPAGRWGSRLWFASLPGATAFYPSDNKDQAGYADDDCGPSEAQSREALAAALALGYRRPRIVSQILALGNANLDYATLDHREIANTTFVPFPAPGIQVTPLEWAVEHDRPDFARLFLDAGAYANHTVWKVEGSTLTKAVRKRNRELVEMLVPESERVTRTRALGLAAIAMALLEGDGATLCDFEEADRHLPEDKWDSDCTLGYAHISELAAGDFVVPLALAVMVGDVALVRLLLGHGADPNRGYHGLYPTAGQYEEDPDPAPYWIHLHSGRAVQLAMELGHDEIVDLLLDYSVNIDLHQPVWEEPDGEDRLRTGYSCCLMPRRVYLRVMAGLEQAVERRGEETVGPNSS